MSQRLRLLKGPPTSLEDRYFSDIRPVLYQLHGKHQQYGVRTGTTLAEHLDSACQFILTVSRQAGVRDPIREILLATAAVHDLNKLGDASGRNVKQLARDRAFLEQQLERACVKSLVPSEDSLELARRLIERHSGHGVSDGMSFSPEPDEMEPWVAMLRAADLFDLGIPEQKRIQKLQTELTVAFERTCSLYQVRISKDLGYITALLLNAAEEILVKQGLTPLAIFPDGVLFEGGGWPGGDLIQKIAARWQSKINEVFGKNIEQLVNPTKDGIKISPQAINQDIDEVVAIAFGFLEKKKGGFKASKIEQDIAKWGQKAGSTALAEAEAVGLVPVSNPEEFAIAEGLKAVYLSYRSIQPQPSTQEVWDLIASEVGISPIHRAAIEPFDPQYARPLFAAKVVTKGREGIEAALRDSLQRRKESESGSDGSEDSTVAPEIRTAVEQLLNLPVPSLLSGFDALTDYITTNPKERSSLGYTSANTEKLRSPNMPPGTKVQMFSNRIPGGMSAEPTRYADSIEALAYQLVAVGGQFPAGSKHEPMYLHFLLPPGSSPELRRIWIEFLRDKARTNPEGGPLQIDERKLYRDNELEFKSSKVVGFAFPQRSDFINGNVLIPLLWGDTNVSVALIKSLWLALELSLSLEIGFPFIVSSHLEIEPSAEVYGKVEGIPTSLVPLLGTGQYSREDAAKILGRLRCLGPLVLAVASPKKRDDCLYDLARATSQPFSLYYVLLRWILREKENPNWEKIWNEICEPLNTLLESLMPDDNHILTQYLKQAAQLAVAGKIWGSYQRTASIEPFGNFIAAIRSQKPYMDLDLVFAALVQNYHTRLDRIVGRITGYKVGATKFEQIKEYYQVLRQLYEEVYQGRAERLTADQKTLEAAYFFFLQEERNKAKAESKISEIELTETVE
ncbi:hypothetical protein [Oscillatoria acuminata]|uniref:CRISPR-associated protein Csc3 n=1 Tax=Oscillatoria acuminata PCC 6304 TaxID=56110 RepID=K9TTK3_9CYAN|nr:hypothetical protein [Oscillatoria acuminata]AFY85314.1 CRISPR-associated protein Csc3 [Oscillatoria acuminata PCC 6304]